jgi:hypothetical protein
MLAEVRKKRKPLRCDECGKKLRQVLERDEESSTGEENTVGTGAYGTGSPGEGSITGWEVAA